MRNLISTGLALPLCALVGQGAIAQPNAKPLVDDAAQISPADRSSAALIDQIGCQQKPQPAKAINALLKHHLVRYADGESGVYGYLPVAPLRFLGFRVTYISGSDTEGVIKAGPPLTMAGTAPPTFLQIDVAAPADALRLRALQAGLFEAHPQARKRGFVLDAHGSYLARKSDTPTSGIICYDYQFAPAG